MLTILARNASEWTGPTGNNTYLLAEGPRVLIDAGVGAAPHLDEISTILGEGLLDLVLITHGHVDHASGAPHLAARWPSVVIRGGGAGAPLQEGAVFATGRRRLRAVHTPGHSPDHFCFFDETSGDLFCGDMARRGGTVVIPASRGGSLAQYLASLERLRSLKPLRLLPAHGPAVEDPEALLVEYLAHRKDRHQQIVRVTAQGITGVDDIVARIYPGLSPRLLDAARETIRAHLAFEEEFPGAL